MQIITSSSNEKVKRLRKLYTKKGRGESGSFLVEGEKFVSEIPEDYFIESFYISESYYERAAEISRRAENIIIKDEIFDAAADTVTPQGIIAVVKRKEHDISDIISKENALVVLCDKLQDPGNLGAIIRNASAFSATAVIVSKSVEIYSPKVVRASAGAVFHLPVINFDILEICGILKCKGVKIAAACLDATLRPEDAPLTESMAFLIGNEGAGLDKEVTETADIKIKIPMSGKTESLNAAVSSAILLYEAQRQRYKYI